MILALSTGARQGELLGLRWPDVDLARKVAVLHDTKKRERPRITSGSCWSHSPR